MDTGGERDLFEVVISGISGKFPLSDDVESFKENLMAQNNLVTEEDCRWSRDEWKIPSATGKISVVNKFDDTFFGMYSGITTIMDPLTRVTMERAYEAVMDAGINPKKLKGGMTAVYTAASTSDSEAVGCENNTDLKFWLLAHIRALMANRISYILNLKGPSWTLDSNWIGGIECLARAENDIRQGRVDNALVGVSNVILFPHISRHWVGLNKLSPDGSCFPFAEDANGYARSESVVFLFLQRECDANRVYGKIAEVNSMFCGDQAETLLKPKQEAFVQFLRSFYSRKNTISKPVAFIETDGSADKYLDEIELNSIGQVLCDENGNENVLAGCVKGNVGHAEAASPFVSITKALISIDSDVIPPNRCAVDSNKRIEKLNTNEIKLPLTPTPFPEGKYAAVNVIGLCSSIGHVLLEPFAKKRKSDANKKRIIPRLVVVSARHEAGLLDIINKLESMPHNDEYFFMINEVFKESIPGYFFKGFTILGTTEKKLHFTLEIDESIKRPIWFVFGGMGSQWPGMGADLMDIPVFAETMRELSSYLSPLGIDLINVITSYDPTILNNSAHSFVGIVAVQIGLVEILKKFGIEADGYFGHSLGENGCAYVDGCFNKYQAIMAAYYRGKATNEIQLPKGLMAAVGLNYKQLTNRPPNVQIACHNAEDNTTISGPYEEVRAYCEELERQKVFVRLVNSNHIAYHSDQVQPVASHILENIRKIVPNPKKRSRKWISTSVREEQWNTPAAQISSADYHVHNFKNTVYFSEACKHVPEHAVVIEISPHGLFQGILKRMVDQSCFVIPLAKRETSNSLNFLLSSIGKLYVVGLKPNVNNIYPPIPLPVSRGTPSLATLATWAHDMDWKLHIHPSKETIKPIEVNLKKPEWRFLNDFRINEKTLMPFSLLLVQTLKAYETKDSILVFENIDILKYTEISASETATIYTQVQSGSGNFEISMKDQVLVSGNLHYSHDSFSSDDDSKYEEFDENYCVVFTRTEIENSLKRHSIDINVQMRDIDKIIFTGNGCCAFIIWNGKLDEFINTIATIKIFLDLCSTNKGPLLTSKILKFSIETEEYFTKKQGSVIRLDYDKNANVFTGPGIQLIGLENSYEVCLEDDTNTLTFENLQFVDHSNPHTKNLENFFLLCGQLVGETLAATTTIRSQNEFSTIEVLLTNDLKEDGELSKKMWPLFKALHQESSQAKIQIKYVTQEDVKVARRNATKPLGHFLISKNIRRFLDDLSAMAESNGNVFFLSLEGNPKIPEMFVKITADRIGKFDLLLYKKKGTTMGTSLKVEPHTKNWLQELEDELRRISPQNQVFLQWSSKSLTEVVNAISLIRTIRSRLSIRYFVNINENTEGLSKYAATSLGFKQEVQKGLITNVYKNGKWGSIRNLMATNLFSSDSSASAIVKQCKRLKDIKVSYVTQSNDLGKRFDCQVLEFSGTTGDRKKLVGIANVTSSHTNDTEVFLSAPVPDQWSLEEAVTVPLPYVKAYYALIEKGKLAPRSTVLVHNGHSVLGEALISIALSLDCIVIVTVANSLHGNYVKERFRHSSRLNIINTQNHQVDKILKASKGVDVAVNPETDKEIQQSLQILKFNGTLLILTDTHMRTGKQFGLFYFKNSIALYSILTHELLNSDRDFKSAAQTWLTESMKRGIVKPFKRLVCNSDDTNLLTSDSDHIKRVVIKLESNPISKRNTFVCHPEKFYLVLGKRDETWFTVVTWLIENNAKKIALVDTSSSAVYDDEYTKSFSCYIENRSDLNFMYLSSEMLQDKQKIADMIAKINCNAQLDAIFCISLNSQLCSNLHYSLRQETKYLRQFICLQCDASEICESRIRSNLPALQILWDENIRNKVSLTKSLRRIIDNCLQLNLPRLFISHMAQFEEKFERSLNNIYAQFLPDFSEAHRFIDTFSKEATFKKVVSKCSYYCTRTQLFPIFVLPALHPHRLKLLIKKLMYPVFCAKYPIVYSSARTVAESLLKPLKHIQPQGPYTIVGESWSGVVAIELASLLEKEYPSTNVNLILIEALPKNMQNRLASLGPFANDKFVSALKEIYFKNEYEPESSKKLFADQTENKFIELLQRKLMAVNEYSSEKAFLRSKVFAINLFEKSVLQTHIDFEQYYGSDLELKTINECDFEKLLNSDITANIINENVLFKW